MVNLEANLGSIIYSKQSYKWKYHVWS